MRYNQLQRVDAGLTRAATGSSLQKRSFIGFLGRGKDTILKLLEIRTPSGDALVDITAQVRAAVDESGAQAGICALVAPHTTAGLIINSGRDAATLGDILLELKRLVPTRVDFKHQYDTPADAAGHIKATLVGQSLMLVIDGGVLLLGDSQSIMFYEFDGPRERQVQVKIIAG